MQIASLLADYINVSPLPHVGAGGSQISSILGVVFGIVGGLSLLFIIIGGFRYVISAGDPQSIAQAKNTILYAVIGMAVAIGAEAIVSFVLGKI